MSESLNELEKQIKILLEKAFLKLNEIHRQNIPIVFSEGLSGLSIAKMCLSWVLNEVTVKYAEMGLRPDQVCSFVQGLSLDIVRGLTEIVADITMSIAEWSERMVREQKRDEVKMG